jgi:uncharacterized membrane protein YkoI
MKSRRLICTLLALGLLTAGVVTPVVAADKQAKQQAKLEAKAKIKQPEAEKIALAKVKDGKVVEAEIEKEHGKLIWSFDIATPGTKNITEVQVDAKTGKVVSVETETPADQEKEKKKEK